MTAGMEDYLCVKARDKRVARVWERNVVVDRDY
jgi:hypothetical protein